MKEANKIEVSKALDEYQAALAINGDRRAFKRLYSRWHPRLLRFAYRMTQNEDEARDVMQEAAMTIARSIHRLENPRSFGPWAYTIVRRRAHDHIDSAIRQRHIKAELVEAPSSNLMEDLDRTLALKQALDRLPSIDRTMLTLFYLDEMTGPELSEAMGIPIGTLKSRLFAARSKLKSIYEQSDIGEINE